MRKLSLNRPKTYGNPFETNVLVRVIHNNQHIQSFFLHELPPNCPVDQLKERIREKNIPFLHWEVYVTHADGSGKKVLHGGVFADYGIRSWDCVWIREVQRKGQNRRSVLRACGDIAQGLKLCFNECRTKAVPKSPRPYGYLSNNGSLFSRESLDYGPDQKSYIL